MKTSTIISVFFLATATLLSGCANTDTRQQSPQYTRSQESPQYTRSQESSQYANSRVAYGVIDNIEVIRGNNDGIGAGTVIGGVVGGILGHQVGGGSGKDVATIAGVAGGAVVGHQMEKNNRQQEAYRIRVHLNQGGYQTVTQSVSDLRIGDRVRIDNNQVTRY